MRILFLTSAHNSLSQRLWIELGERGHEIRVCVAATGETMIAAVSREAPDLIIAPMLKIAIPKEVWSRHLCLIVHPGIKGDRGPSSLDWAIANGEKIWGVTILEAADDFDAGAIWASHEFALSADPPAKSGLYRRQVTEAALRGVLEAIARIESGASRERSRVPMSGRLGMNKGRLTSLVRLSYLGPEIVRALLVGSQSNALTPSRLLRLSKNLPFAPRTQTFGV
jgi:putative two-component system hydrogenase maturation factor HypX/HoxX